MRATIKEYLESDDVELNETGLFYLIDEGYLSDDDYEVLAWFA